MSPLRLVTVTLNPALDRHYTVPGFGTDGVFRANAPQVHAGGKGINVARVWTTLGGVALATGYLGGRTGEIITEKLADEAIDGQFLSIAGETRLALSLFNPDNRSEAIVNEVGPTISAVEYAPLIGHVASIIDGAAYLALSGSAPPGVPVEVYGNLIEAARQMGVRTAVDVSGDALVHAVGSRPFLVKPNREEARAIGAQIASWSDAPAAAQDIRERYGIEIVIITGGPDGAVVAAPDGVWTAISPNIDIVSTLGSGDSTLAGFLWALGTGGNCGAALTLAMACGAANAVTVGAGRCSAVLIDEMSGKIEAVKLS